MLYLPCHLWEDFREKKDHLRCREVSKEVYRKLFETIAFQKIRRHLCTSVCSLRHHLHRQKGPQRELGVSPFVLFVLLLLRLL